MAYKEKKTICVKNYGDKAGWMISHTFILFFKYIFMEKKDFSKTKLSWQQVLSIVLGQYKTHISCLQTRHFSEGFLEMSFTDICFLDVSEE